MADGRKPWVEKRATEKARTIVSGCFTGLIGCFTGLMLLGFVAALISAGVDETRWAFTRVIASSVCASGHRDNCLIRTPGRVKSTDGSSFSLTLDRAPYLEDASVSHGPAPVVGSVVFLEEWNERLVSVFDPARGRRHADQWPNRTNDLLEAALAFALLAVPAVCFFTWLAKVWKRRRSSPSSVVTGSHAQTS